VPPEPQKVADALRDATRALKAAGVRDPELDAELLLRHVLGWDRARLLAYPETPLEGAAHDRYLALVAERASRRPIQHLLGTAHFWRHEFLVTPDVLIPRPETELLVETSLELLKGVERPVVVDVGAGSGCIALSLAAERPDAFVHATDISEEALAVARENTRRLGLADRVTFHLGDLLAPVAHLAGRIDLVVSNPPYVDASEVEGLEPEVRDHDPRLALVPPSGDRYATYRQLAPQAAVAIRPAGWLLLEMGAGMAPELVRLLVAAGLEPAPPAADLAAVPRVLSARRA